MNPANDIASELEALSEQEIQRILLALDEYSDLAGLESWEREKVENAIKCDPSGITAALYLSAKAGEVAADTALTVEEVLKMTEETREFLRKVTSVRAVTQEPGINSAISRFQDRLRAAATHYGVAEKVEETITDRDALAYIRSSAFRTFARLHAHQFAQGEGDPSGFKYNQWIHEFNNVNSLIRIVGNQPESGVTLTLIRDDEIPEFSFFGFAVRNGQTVTFLTESLGFDNPDQKYMRRNPGRDFERRLDAGAYFPYDLIGEIKEDSQGHLYIKRDPAQGRLVTYQTKAIKLAPLSDMKPHEIVWTILMFDFIRDKFWRQNHQTPELSYTAEMLEYPLALHTSATALDVTNYQRLEVPRLTGKDVDARGVQGLFELEPTGFHDWMEERYGDQVNDAIYNVLSPEGAEALPIAKGSDGKMLDGWVHNDDSRLAFWEKPEARYRISHLPATEFGTKSQIVKTYKYVARKNRARALQALAVEEFRKERDNVLRWYRESCTRNLPVLKEAIAKGEFLAPIEDHRSSPGSHFVIGGPGYRTGNILGIAEARGGLSLYGIGQEGLILGEENKSPGRKIICVERSGIRASGIGIFNPHEAGGLALLAGCAVEELPVFLQYWRDGRPYSGNQILSDVDPLEWSLCNPWVPELHIGTRRNTERGLCFRIAVPFSKRALARWKKEFGVE